MKIFVKAKAGSKENKVEPPPLKLWSEDDKKGDYYTVSVKEPAKQGKANQAIEKLLAEYFKTSLSHVRLVSGASAKRKVFEIISLKIKK